MRLFSAVQNGKMRLLAFVLLVSATSSPCASKASALRVLCESYDGNSYLGIFENTPGAFSVSTSGNLELGKTVIREEQDKFVLLAESNWEPIVIPRGKNEVAIASAIFNCDY